MNFTSQDFARGLYFSTWTFNNFQTDLKFSFSFWTANEQKCPLNCQKPHLYQTVPTSASSFLAEKRIAKKQLNRTSDGVNDLFAIAIANIQKIWQPQNFKWVAVPELHKCQTPCHWKGKKSKKKGWKNHSESNCPHSVKHDCLRNWHIHMLSTDFLPDKYQHQKCGLGKYTNQGSPSGCWDHRAYIAHEIWPHGLVDIKRVSHLKVQGKPIQNAESLILYLVKYLAKSFQMRENKELAQKVGLLRGMGVYKFFRIIYGYQDSQAYISEKRKKPLQISQVFINNDYGFNQEVEKEFSPYFENGKEFRLKKQARQILKKNPPPAKPRKITEFLKLCLLHSTKSKIKQNQFWKLCDTEEPTWTKGIGWERQCLITLHHHTEPIIRWEFEFNGERSYSNFQKYIRPALSQINLPNFTKFSHWIPKNQDFNKFAYQTKLPWNKEINIYEPNEEIGESSDSSDWQAAIPFGLIYNYVYLKEIRSQISGADYSPQLTADQSIKRYADY